VSHIQLNRAPFNVFVVCHAAGKVLVSSADHAAYVAAVSDRFQRANDAALAMYTPHNLPGSLFLERVNNTAYALVPCVLGNRTLDDRTHVIRTEIGLVEARDEFVTYGSGAQLHMLTGAPRPADGVVIGYSSSLAYGSGPAKPSAEYASEWRIGLRRLSNMLGSPLFVDSDVHFAQGSEVCSNTYGRLAVPFNAACPLCKRDGDGTDGDRCPYVHLRLMRFIGLRAECSRARVIAGPVLAPHYGEFSPAGERHSIDIGTVVDANGKSRVAPVSAYWDQVPKGHALIHAAQPDSGKTYSVLVHLLETLEVNLTERRFYVLVAPTISLAISLKDEFNKLFRERASQRLERAVRFLYGFEHVDEDDAVEPCRFYKDVSASDMYTGGILSTTVHSLWRYRELFENSKAPLGFALTDEFEKLVPMAMNPKLATSSSVMTNVATLFQLFKAASERGAPLHVVDGLVTRELTEHVVAACSVPYVVIKCPALRNYAGKHITEIHDFITCNQDTLAENDTARGNGNHPVRCFYSIRSYKRLTHSPLVSGNHLRAWRMSFRS
jgi:hypothetical protein